MTYKEFLETKIELAKDTGFEIDRDKLNPAIMPHQKDAVQWALKGGRRALFESFGLGKCHGKGTEILMYDCTIRKVEDVKVGDLLMGDDGTPRKVLSLARGIDDMYRVTLKNGDSFTCNSAHILSCEMSNKYLSHKSGEVVNIPITEFLQLPEYAQRNCYKAYKRPLEFETKRIDFDPYVYGLWLGDGTRCKLDFTINNKDIEIVDYLNKWVKKHGLSRRDDSGRGCVTYHYSKGAGNNQKYSEKEFIKSSCIGGEKRISRNYLINSREIRLAVLAGLLDTDGYLVDNCYEIATVFPGLKDDILFLCRSLGLSVSHTVKEVNGKEYQRIWISGYTDEIPCLTRKKASERRQIKNPLRYGIEVEPIGVGEYYGFTIDGNHLYMLGDFTVTHNTVQELEFCYQAVMRDGGQALIVCPLGVKQEFTRDAQRILGYDEPPYCKTMDEVRATDVPIILTNYERVRDGDIDPKYFTATSLDEAAVLRSFGSKTYQTFLDKFKGVPYKMVATATPSPNKYKELIHYAGYLEIMDTGQALTRFFQRDSTKANNLTLYPNMEDEFWLWISSWALFITKPSDLNPEYSDEGYELPPLEVRWHELPIGFDGNAVDRDGQISLFTDAAQGLTQGAKVKRESIDKRITEMKRIVDESPNDHFVLWHDLESERHAIKQAIPDVVDIYGSQDYDIREKRIMDFSDGKTRLFATKKILSGCGCNFQRYCHREIFLGIDYQFHDFIQAIHRCYRFLQTEPVIIDIIYMENEREIRNELEKKWKEHDYMVDRMISIVKKYGLNTSNMTHRLERKMGVEGTREERTVKGKHYTAVYGDCVEETRQMGTNSVDLIHTSIPFGNHYEYSSNYNDFGHNQNTDRFFEQMDYLTPELLRVLKPGRVAAIHVKDRVLFGNATGTGMPTVEPFHALCISHYMKHGFQYFGMITVVTDVVRENNQTYRLGWTEQCKDGSKMGVGCPEYVLLFRKLPTDRSTAYADEPVTKSKKEYTRGQWQLDAHGYWRSSGNRLVSKDELKNISVDMLQKVYREYSRSTVYNYEDHVKLANDLDEQGKLPAIFMVIAPGSWNTLDVWDDINRMKTLNTTQSRRNQQMHVCLAEGSLVLTRNGYKPIENVETGDMVLTHKGNWKPVIATACTGIKDTVQVKAEGVPNLILTPDHKLWCRKHDYVSPLYRLEDTEPTWIEAQDTKGGFVNLKLPEVEESSLSAQEWWVVGRYLADGHIGTRKDYFISVGVGKETEFEEKAKGFYGSYAQRDNCKQYRLYSSALSEEMRRTLSKCGHGALNKQVPIEGLCLNKELSSALLDGYLSGDGNKTENATSATSVSRALLLGMAMVAQRVAGRPVSVFPSKPAGKHVIEGREVNQNQCWVMSWRDGKWTHSRTYKDGAWKRVKTVENVGKRKVYSIQVQDDASYTAEGCIVKNCPLQIDIVERIINRYSNKGDLIYDPFGGLGTVPKTAIEMERDGYMCELNDGYFRDAVGYLQAAENEVESPTLFDFLKEEETT